MARVPSTSPGMTKSLADWIATRRHFIKVSATAAGALGLAVKWNNLFAENTMKPLRILILGGTGFTGPFQVKYALSRGHKGTVFNRDKTHPGELPKEV